MLGEKEKEDWRCGGSGGMQLGEEEEEEEVEEEEE